MKHILMLKSQACTYGQCSELCGYGHGFMPISVKAVSEQEFAEWLEAETEFANDKFKNDNIAAK